MAIAGLSARLFLDHHIDPHCADDLRRHGYDVTYPRELGTMDESDEFHLIWASEQGRVILTYDRADFQRLASRWSREGRDHAGIIIAVAPPRLPHGELLRRLLGLLDHRSADQLVNQVLWLDESWRS